MTQQEMHLALCEWMGGYHKPTPEEVKSGVYYQYEPLLTLDWLHGCEMRLDNEKNLIDEKEGWETQLDRYLNMLEMVCESACPEDDLYWFTVTATKEQRLEALCRTLWPERFKSPKTS